MTHSLSIVFEDNHLAVLNKPAGLLSQSDVSGDESLVDLLRIHFGRHYVGLVHRLDRNTSGLMVVAKRTKAARRLTESLQKKAIQRTYWAIITGQLSQKVCWKHYLEKNPDTNTVTVAKKGAGKLSIMHAEPISTGSLSQKVYTLAEIELETGRSHQIRVQSAEEGHALLGDPKYGSGLVTEILRPALHAKKIRFPHPMSNEKLQFEIELPQDMHQIVKDWAKI